MNRTCQSAVGFLAAVVLIPALASAQGKALALGENGDVELTAVTSIGPVTLQPGHYRLQYHEQDGRHYLIVKVRKEERRAGRDYGIGSGTEVARVACMLVPLGQKSSDTRLFLKADPDGTSRVTQIRIQGEAAGHIIALGPQG